MYVFTMTFHAYERAGPGYILYIHILKIIIYIELIEQKLQVLEEELEEKTARAPLSTKKDVAGRLRRGSLVGPTKKGQEDQRKTSSELTIVGQLLLEKLPSPKTSGDDKDGMGTYLSVVVKFVSSMSQLEQYMDGIQDVLVLQDAAARKFKSRKNLKSEYVLII